jgi:hypothetical protein
MDAPDEKASRGMSSLWQRLPDGFHCIRFASYRSYLRSSTITRMRTQICERKGVERIIRMVLNLGDLTYGLEVAASAIGIKLHSRI